MTSHTHIYQFHRRCGWSSVTSLHSGQWSLAVQYTYTGHPSSRRLQVDDDEEVEIICQPLTDRVLVGWWSDLTERTVVLMLS